MKTGPSAIGSSNGSPVHHMPVSQRPGKERFNLGRSFQQACELHHSYIQHYKPVIRCDELPEIHGNADEFTRLFYLLLMIAFRQSDANVCLLLYVKCDEANNNIIYQSGGQEFKISFFANLKEHLLVKQHQSALQECENLCARAGCMLNYSFSPSDSCLFTIILRGNGAE